MIKTSALNVFEKFSNLFPEYKIVTIGKQNSQFPNHLGLPYLSASDLEYAFINSYCLIYATLFEGYGYPPIEAMKYGKPVIASNVCSIPEILADSPIYFSPFYKVDLMKALMKVTSEYEFYCKKSILRYREIQELQTSSHEKLAKLILN
jgi:glycosyltransferase involved in cell wall biosynthesis